jgi:hypothetical protein
LPAVSAAKLLAAEGGRDMRAQATFAAELFQVAA